MLLLVLALAQGPIELTPGMVITQSVRVKPKTYNLSGPPITIRGDGITVDFAGATLLRIDPALDPDQRRDTAIVVAGGRDIQILNARIHGFRFGIIARGTERLTIRASDLSHSWKPRLFSLLEHESLVDWLSFHHNENDEWLRFGAAVYLQDVRGADLRQNVALDGMSGVLLVRTTGAMIRENNFSFNSGLGIGLYRSSEDTIVHNRLDYNVRGYSHGRYSRGQDSAGLLMFEQSSRNYVAFNSMTHSGDGIFLWAGQTTMDSGTGGANDNTFYANDVSYATANGIEVTFSSNTIIGNRAWGSEYGVWGGYSFGTRIAGNDFRGNRTGIAIEHGQNNTIDANLFAGDSTAIRLWADSIEPSDWGYPKHHDTRSHSYWITGNAFVGNRVGLRIRNTQGVVFERNRAKHVDSLLRWEPIPDFQVGAVTEDTVPEGRVRISDSIPSSELSRRDRSAIVVDEWGPYDWQSPKLWFLGRDSGDVARFRLAVLGPQPPERWRLTASRGITEFSKTRGFIGDTILVTPSPTARGDWSVTLVSRGKRFWYSRFVPRIDWTVTYFTWTDSTNFFAQPVADSLILASARGRLDFLWYRPPTGFRVALPQDHWSLRASATVTLPPGTYSLRTISDDAVRVWVDNALVIDNWKPHDSQVDYAPLAGGKHDLRVEYGQVDGWVELRVDIIRGTARSTGSPGPH